MKRFRQETGMSIWTGNLILLASAVFMNRFGQGLLGGARTNFFIETLGLSGGQVLSFRDYAFQSYYTSPRYLNMIGKKFGPQTASHIREMAAKKLARKHAEF